MGTQYNIYANHSGDKKKMEAIELAIYCLQNGIDMMKLDHTELMKLKIEYNNRKAEKRNNTQNKK